MNKVIILSIALALSVGSISGKSFKRGVSENEFRFVQQAEALATGVSWYYTWGGAPHYSTADFEGMDFIPMAWNASENFLTSAREYLQTHPNVKYILGYNEPNFTSQSNMTPQQAAEAWPNVQALAKEFGLKIVAPALNYTSGSWQPVQWLKAFTDIVGEDAYDYTAIHNYGGLGVMIDLATQFHDNFKKDVWVTEFCYWPGESGYVAPATQIASMMESVEWLEKTPWIYRYAWFKAIGNSDSKSGPNYGLLLSGRGDEKRELSEQGYVYVYMTDFNAEVYHPVNEIFSATDYINQEHISLGRGYYKYSPKPIQITNFSAGATLDYQVDVPADGNYTLRLMVSGFGEPTRFDPCMSVVSVNEDGSDGETLTEKKQFALPNSDYDYIPVDFDMTLKAGKQTLRLKDMYPYQPSGIHIATLTLYDEETLPASGVTAIEVESAGVTEYYTLQGIKVEKPAEPGIYLELSNGQCRKIVITQ